MVFLLHEYSYYLRRFMGHWWIENETYPLKILKKLKLTLEETALYYQ